MESVIATNGFIPHPLFQGGHSQTLAAYFLTGSPLIPRNRDVIVPTKDGDKILCRLSEPDPSIHGTTTRVVFLFHGLAGSSESAYMTHAAKRFNDEGWIVVRVNQRCAGDSWRISRKLYHSGRLQDYEDAFVQMKALNPHWRHVIFIGYSMSGNMVLKYGSNLTFQQPHAIISVCAPLRLKDASVKMNLGFNKTYQLKFVKDLLKILAIKNGENFIRSKKLTALSTLYDFDREFVAAEAGVKNAEEYYQMTSCFDHLSSIVTPHFMIATDDDPIVSITVYLQARLNKLGKFYRFQNGGHIGFISQGSGFKPQRSLENYLLSMAEKSLQDTLKITTTPKGKLS